MKQTLISVSLLLGIILLHWQCNQDQSGDSLSVPNRVLMNFRSQYPNADQARWEEFKGLYVAEFDKGALSLEVLYNQNGDWLQTEEALKKSQLPLPVVYAIEHGEYRNWQIESFELRSFPDQPEEFVAEFVNDTMEVEISYNDEGEMVRKRNRRIFSNS